MTADNKTFVCAECGGEFPIRPSAIVTGVTDAGTTGRRQLCIACWSDGTTLVGYRGP